MIEVLKKANSVWEKYTHGATGTIIYVLVGFLVAYLVNAGLGLALDTDTPMVAVFSNSMVPVFYKGDLVFVSGMGEEVSLGDIIVFDAGNMNYPVIHRVYKINKDGTIKTMGDNNNGVVDPWIVTKDQIHGKASFKLPYLGWIKVLFVEILM